MAKIIRNPNTVCGEMKLINGKNDIRAWLQSKLCK